MTTHKTIPKRTIIGGTTGIRLSKNDTRRWRSTSARRGLLAELLEKGFKVGTIVRDHKTAVLGRLTTPTDPVEPLQMLPDPARCQLAPQPEPPPAQVAPAPQPKPQPTRKLSVELVTAAQEGRALSRALTTLVPSASSATEALQEMARELLRLRRERLEMQLTPAELAKLRTFLGDEPAAVAPEEAPEEAPETERPGEPAGAD